MTQTSLKKSTEPDAEDNVPGRRKTIDIITGNWVFLALIVLVVVFTIAAGTTFFSFSNLAGLLNNNAGLFLLAIGAAYLIIGGQLDLSIGSVLVFSSVIGGKVLLAVSGATPDGQYDNIVLATILGFVACMVTGAAWGLLNGVLVTRLKIPSFIVTLGTLGIALGLAQVITKGRDVGPAPRVLQSEFATKEILGLTIPVWITALIVIVAGLVLSTTKFGRYTYAVGSNPEGARRTGIKVNRQIIILFTMMGALAGLAGALQFTRFTSTSISGHATDNLLAISAVIIGGASLFGGRGTIFGTAVGVMIPAVLNNGLILIEVQPFWQTVAIGTILIIAVTFDQFNRSRLLKS